MQFANPTYLPLIATAVAILVLFFLAVMKRRATLIKRFADKNLISQIAPSSSIRKKWAKMIMLIAAAGLLLLALARPQWGFEWQETKMVGLDILLAIDVSKSMLARDIKPNRLERSKFAVKDLVKKLNGDRIGLIAFAGTAFLQCPLTIDYNGFMLALDDLTTSSIPRGGTSISSAIREAMNVYKDGDQKYKILIIITDGEELEGSAIAAAEEAKKMGIRIYCVGVGSAEGEIIPITDDRGERAYLEDRSGAIVKTSLNEGLLKNIALSTGGSYVRATSADFGLSLLYDKSISKLEKHDIDTRMRKNYQERFQIFLAIALAVLAIEPLVSERKRVSR
jgi:Ca-activated chloride channel family protein